jgi:hypothetical protein
MHDPITAPDHYTVYPVQPIALTRHLSFCLGNAVKYILRAPYKGGVEDLRKAIQYLEWEKEAPQSPISAFAYSQAEVALSAIVDYLLVQHNFFAVSQVHFLIALDSYIQMPSFEGGKALLSMARQMPEAVP